MIAAGGHRPRIEARPIVFVHGGSGSGQQYETQAMRFASNDYPELVTAIDRISATPAVIQPILDEFFAKVRADTGHDKLYVVGHSQGVAVMNAYLNSSPERAAGIAKYIGIDSASGPSPDVCPGGTDADGTWVVPCMGVWGRGDPARRLGPDDNVQFPEQGHVEVVGSPESFKAQYTYLAGREPRTTEVLPDEDGRFDVSGRAVNYPANTPLLGADVQVWKVDAATGRRSSRRPVAQFTIGEDGNFGPVRVERKQRYEFTVIRHTPDGDRFQHFYQEAFVRSDHLIRLNLSPLDSPLSTAITRGPNHSIVSVVRQKEWWGDHPVESDELLVGTRRAGGVEQAPVNILNGATAPTSGNPIGIITFDDGADGVSHPEQLIPRLGAFLTGVDVFYPAADPVDGTISLAADPRGLDVDQQINLPNWASSSHASTVAFRDFAPAPDRRGHCRSGSHRGCD